MSLDWHALAAAQPALAALPASLRAAASVQAFTARQTLYRQGQRPRAVLCVLEGEIRLVRRSPRGDEIILQRVRGGFVAEASLDASAYHCDVVAAAAGRLLRFPVAAFREALEQDAAFNRAWSGHLAQEIRRLRAQCERLGLNGAAARILHYLEAEGRDGAITLTQSRKAWAAELGLTHEVLYRTLRRLREDGTLRIDGDRIARG